jgi:hypothetical protein
VNWGHCLAFAQQTGTVNRFLPWLEGISGKTTFALITNSQYPICYHDYSDLLFHPASSDQSYRDEACVGSILYPYLYLWMHHATEPTNIAEFTERLQNKIPNCTHQAWFPDEDTDEHNCIVRTGFALFANVRFDGPHSSMATLLPMSGLGRSC